MQALVLRATALAVTCGLAANSDAATAKTPNFVVHAPNQKMADEVGRAAEHYRRELAIEWIGKPLPRWYKPCPINVRAGEHLGAGGDTTFSFDRGQVFGWRMNVQGSIQRILDSVLPHEVSHTIFACHFKRPLPRWADEGAATLVEHESERRRQTRTLAQVIRTSRRIPLSQLLMMTEYPTAMEDVLTLYAEGYSLADLLVQEKGKAVYLKFLEDGHRSNWSRALQVNYGYRSIPELEQRWHNWVVAGSPAIESPAKDGHLLAGGDAITPDQFTAEGYARSLAQSARGQSPSAPSQQPLRTAASPESRGLTLGRSEPLSMARSNGDTFAQAAMAAVSEQRPPARIPRREVGDPLKERQPPRELATAAGRRPKEEPAVTDGRLPRPGIVQPIYRERIDRSASASGRAVFRVVRRMAGQRQFDGVPAGFTGICTSVMRWARGVIGPL